MRLRVTARFRLDRRWARRAPSSRSWTETPNRRSGERADPVPVVGCPLHPCARFRCRSEPGVRVRSRDGRRARRSQCGIPVRSDVDRRDRLGARTRDRSSEPADLTRRRAHADAHRHRRCRCRGCAARPSALGPANRRSPSAGTSEGNRIGQRVELAAYIVPVAERVLHEPRIDDAMPIGDSPAGDRGRAYLVKRLPAIYQLAVASRHLIPPGGAGLTVALRRASRPGALPGGGRGRHDQSSRVE